MTPREFAAVTDGWKWRHEQQRVRSWEAAYLQRVEKMPSVQEWLDPPRTKRLTPDEVKERRAGFEAAKAASDRIPVKPRTKG